MNIAFTDKDGQYKFEGYQTSDKSLLESEAFKRVMALVNFNGEIVIIRSKSGWGLPGGSREEGESVSIAAVRELQEEADVIVSATDILPVAVMKAFKMSGDRWEHIEDQIILYCEIDNLPPLTPDPDEDIVERKVVPADMLGEYISWKNSIPWLQEWIKDRL